MWLFSRQRAMTLCAPATVMEPVKILEPSVKKGSSALPPLKVVAVVVVDTPLTVMALPAPSLSTRRVLPDVFEATMPVEPIAAAIWP